MSVQIIYKISGFKKFSSNSILFVDEKYNINGLKKYLSIDEFSYISDLLKTVDLKKKLQTFQISSKKKNNFSSCKKRF